MLRIFFCFSGQIRWSCGWEPFCADRTYTRLLVVIFNNPQFLMRIIVCGIRSGCYKLWFAVATSHISRVCWSNFKNRTVMRPAWRWLVPRIIITVLTKVPCSFLEGCWEEGCEWSTWQIDLHCELQYTSDWWCYLSMKCLLSCSQNKLSWAVKQNYIYLEEGCFAAYLKLAIKLFFLIFLALFKVAPPITWSIVR